MENWSIKKRKKSPGDPTVQSAFRTTAKAKGGA
jgi:hypothetical protein